MDSGKASVTNSPKGIARLLNCANAQQGRRRETRPRNRVSVFESTGLATDEFDSSSERLGFDLLQFDFLPCCCLVFSRRRAELGVRSGLAMTHCRNIYGSAWRRGGVYNHHSQGRLERRRDTSRHLIKEQACHTTQKVTC